MGHTKITRMNRREALKFTGVAVGTLATSLPVRAAVPEPSPGRPRLCLFSKPLHNRTFRELPGLLNELGIDGVDLTCRPQGHVLPERVESDLPDAVECLREAGVAVPMITTAIVDAREGNAEAIIKTVASLKIRHIKLGYYPYGNLHRLHQTLAEVKARLRGVVAICKRYGIQAGFHNHSGGTVGAALWDIWQLIEDLPADAVGSYFDIRHATAEGGHNGWRIGMSLLSPRIIMAAVKDFLWVKDAKKGWTIENVALGKGMVRVEETMRRFKELGFSGPMSVHMEYMAGGQHTPAIGSDEDKANLASIRNDWTYMKSQLQKAGMVR